MDEIRFYRATEKPYGAFSNLSRHPVMFEGRAYPTAEHAYQAGKVKKEEVREWMLSAPRPSLVALVGHHIYEKDIVDGWSETRFLRMYSVLRSKFSQHKDLAELLLSTGNARLVEAGDVDNETNRVWGEVNGVGQNRLGRLLMRVRGELREELE
jgi:ribA/ribD-fused uncharacterized protein